MSIRKQWLTSFLAYMGSVLGSALILNLCGLSVFKENGKILEHPFTTHPGLAWMLIVIWLIVILILGWITYHCAYRKRGTAWLMAILICIPIGIFSELQHLIEKSPFDSIEHSSISWILLAVNMIISGWFWICCLRYRRKNLQIKFVTKNNETTVLESTVDERDVRC